MTTPDRATDLSCSFCGRDQKSVGTLVPGRNGFICPDCVGVAIEILSDEGIQMSSRSAGATAEAALVERAVRMLRQAGGELGRTNFALADEALRLAEEMDRQLRRPS
jgi:hypothetical protein